MTVQPRLPTARAQASAEPTGGLTTRCRDRVCPRQRARRRALLRLDRREARVRARLQKGQTLIIFALTLTILLGIAGLVIDVARAYDLYARMQRAADAGAVAGVLYMPLYYNTVRPTDTNSAISRVMQEVLKDGFGNGTAPAGNPCPTPYSSVEIAICQVPNNPTDLEVIITEHLDVTLLGELGVTPFVLQAHSQAEYLPSVQIGSRENYFGDQVECSPGNSSNTNTTACAPNATGVNHLQSFMATLDGPDELKEAGDPFVYCAEGDAEPTAGPNQATTNSLSTYNGYPTNHPQWPGIPTGTTYTGGISQYCGQPVPGGNHGNPDYQPPGYDGPATSGTPHDGGYNYYIGLMPGAADSSLWIYNPYYIPQDTISGDCTTGTSPIDHFSDGSTGNASCPGGAPANYYQGWDGNGLGTRFDGTHHDAPLFYFAVTYTLYAVFDLYDRTSDHQIATETFSPYDATSADLATHGCVAGQVYNPYWSADNTPNTYHEPNTVVPGAGCVSSSALSSVCPSDLAWCPLVNCGTWTPSSTSTSSPAACALNGATGSAPTLQSGQNGQAYRLVVEAWGIGAVAKNPNGGNDYVSNQQYGWGQHSYALKLCALPASSLTTPINCPNGDGSSGAGGFNNSAMSLYAWNNDDITFQEPLSTASANGNFPQTSCVQSNGSPYACADLGCIPSLYAGRTLTLRLFEPGNGSGNLYVGVAPPPNNSAMTISYPTNLPSSMTTTLDGDTVVQTHTGSPSSGYRPFNGLWLDVTIRLSSTYQGDCFSTGARSGRSGWLQLVYLSDSTSSIPNDKLAIQFTLVGSPVHLVPPALN